MILFLVLGSLISIAFAILLGFSVFGVVLIHPFLSVLGLVGGLGWVATSLAEMRQTREIRRK